MNTNVNESDHVPLQNATPADMAAETVRNVSGLIERSAVIRGTLPPDASVELVHAVRAGMAANMLADLTKMTVGAMHPLMGAVTEFISVSMGLLCHFTHLDTDLVSRQAAMALNKVNEVRAQHAPSDDMGTPTIVQGEPPTPQ